ncbi:MAG TPA: alpha/beta fold hydrolase [Streptosporangiaceae bacterium]|nr:alpha/beta fold hydrolase [Streptosporangiaceae bacterium]
MSTADHDPRREARPHRLTGDVEALRAHLGRDRMDLLGHSAAGNLVALYAAAYPQRVQHLVNRATASRPSGPPGPPGPTAGSEQALS